MGILLCVFAGFAAALAAPAVRRAAPRAAGWILALVPAAVLVHLTSYVGAEPVAVSYAWVPDAGVRLAFYVDGLSLFFALLVSAVAAVVLAYSSEYVREADYAGRFYAYMLVFVGSMLGLVLADDVVTFYVFFELTGLSSFLLIGLETDSAPARRAAKQALIVTGAGGLALLAGVLLLAEAGGAYAFSELLQEGEAVRASPLYASVVVLIAAGAFAKSAQMPFHFWLPNAMVAPTPVSAFLHAAAMVKAGIYLLARVAPVLGGTGLWTLLLTAVGGVTMLAAAWLALREVDLKRVLAYATIMALGMMTMLLGAGTPEAVEACLLYVLVHACYKAALFMTSGTLQHETGTRDVRELRGLRRTMVPTFAVAVVAGVSMAGIPPSLGALGKEHVYAALLSEELLLTGAFLANAALVAATGVVALRPFLGRPGDAAPDKNEGVSELWIAPGILAAAGLALGLFPGRFGHALLAPAVSSTLGARVPVELETWSGFTPEFGLGVLTLAAGAGLFAALQRLRAGRPLGILSDVLGEGPDRAYEAAQRGLGTAASGLTNALQNGLLRRYLLVVFAAAAGLTGAALVLSGDVFGAPDLSDVRMHEWLIAGTILTAAAAAVHVRSRLGAVLLLSTASYGIALIFLLAGAPDLAMTQLLVETLLGVLIVLAFVDLPPLEPLSSRRSKAVDAAAAAAVGIVVTLVMLAVIESPFDAAVAEYYVTHSVEEGHGRNVVNVILTEFRALDTLGEITVLAVAGLSILVFGRRGGGARANDQPEDVRNSP